MTSKTKDKFNKYFFSLWNVYYTIFIFVIQIFLIKNQIYEFYILVKNSNDLINKQSNQTHQQQIITDTLILIQKTSKINLNIFYELLIRLIIILLVILLLILFVVTSIKPIGNYANDNYRYGYDDYEKISKKLKKHKSINDIDEDDEFEEKSINTTNNKKTKMQKTKTLFKLIWQHFLPLNSLLHLCISFIIIFTNLNLNKHEINNHNKTQFNQTLQNDDTYKLNYTNFIEFLCKIELLNYFLAIFVLVLRYSSIYWYLNKTLSFLLSLLGLYICVEQCLQLYSYYYLLNTMQNFMFDLKLKIINKILVLNFLYFIHSFLQIFSLVPLYWFIYTKYKNEIQIMCSSTYYDTHSNTFIGTYCTHLIAIIHLILLCLCKIPFIYDYLIFYYQYYDFGLMLCMCIELLFILIYIFLWLLLTLKINWSINMNRQLSILNDLRNHVDVNISYDDHVDNITIKRVVTQEAPTKKLNNDEFTNETLYRNEIRKSIANILQKSQPKYYFNNTAMMTNRQNLPHGVYLTSSSSSSTNINPTTTTASNRILPKYDQYTQQSMICHTPKSRRAVVSLDRGVNLHPHVEYESRV